MASEDVWNYREALTIARLLAAEGPRVAAIIHDASTGSYRPLEGYVDSNAALPNHWKQIALVTPDGRVWRCKRQRPAAIMRELHPDKE